MSTNRGIFESFPSQPANRPDSPFAGVHEPATEQSAAPASPFAAVGRQESPFMVVDDAAESRTGEFGKPVKLPERRKVDSPFQVAEPSEGFGFEAPAPAFAASPFEAAQAAFAPSPFSTPALVVPASPFAVAPEVQAAAVNSTQAAIAAFANWHEPPPVPTAPAPPAPPAFGGTPAQVIAPPAHVPSAFAESPQASQPQPSLSVQQTPLARAPVTPSHADDSQSDSVNIRQLELRAIFGVDREMNADEILQRSRALPGMRNIARVGSNDMSTLDALKNLLPSLGFGGGALKLYSGAIPLEFIREGPVMLAVQTDGGFAPGVRETLMIVARELGRIG